jgi:hypothetical protein
MREVEEGHGLTGYDRAEELFEEWDEESAD